MSDFQNLKWWQKPITVLLILAAFPFVLLWRVWVTAKWRVWAGRIYLRKGNHGRG
jgi:hypothetical protein